LNTSRSTAAIILAAGSSSRMGGGYHKLLLPLDGRPVLTHVLAAAVASQARPILVILGHQAEQVRTNIRPYSEHHDITLIHNANYLQGMSTSLRLGLQTLLSDDYKNKSTSYQVDSALIMLGDQPLITAKIIDTLITTYRTSGRSVVAPLYDGKRGSPVLFNEKLFPELIEVIGDEGGRTVLEHYPEELELVEMGTAVANYDVDTCEAYQQVVGLWKSKGKVKTDGRSEAP
jgi:molybdenum cofactor cytidylyltransferase